MHLYLLVKLTKNTALSESSLSGHEQHQIDSFGKENGPSSP